jgi:hypothetical protein
MSQNLSDFLTGTLIGFTGSRGDTGFTGSQGIQGVIGFTGSRGDTGFTGSQGIQGVIGFTGSQGIQGETGFTGSQGVIGFTGSQGDIGFTGSQGDTGAVTASILFQIFKDGEPISTGIKGDVVIPFNATISEWSLLGDQTGSAVVDIWKSTYANYPPTSGNSITASAKPTISASNKGQSSTLTGWTTTISAGDILRFNVDSISTIQRLSINLRITRT